MHMNYDKSPFLIAAKWSLLLLVFTPFLIEKNTLFPYIEGKTVFLRVLATLSLVFLALFFVFGKRWLREQFVSDKIRLLKNPIVLFVSLFLLASFFGMIFAKSSFRAFFGTVERGEGFIGLLFFTLIFFLAFLLFERREWKLFFGAVAASGVVFFLQQIYQISQASWN